MRYDPGAAASPALCARQSRRPRRTLGERIVGDALTLCRALGYDLNTVEFAVEDGIPYAIDFMNPAPDAGLESVGPENFEWIVEAVAEMAISRALAPPAADCEFRWAAFLGSVGRRHPMSHVSNIRPSLNIGIEEEYQTIDPETRDLRSHIHAEIVQKGKHALAERVKPEMHQSVVEIGTGVCKNIQEARGRNPRRSAARSSTLARAERTAPRRPAARIPSRTGASRRSIPTSATARSWKT